MSTNETPADSQDKNSQHLIDAAPELLKALEVAMARAYAAGYQHGHHDTVEGQFVDVHASDVKDYFAENVREMMSDGSQPEARAAIAKARGGAL